MKRFLMTSLVLWLSFPSCRSGGSRSAVVRGGTVRIAGQWEPYKQLQPVLGLRAECAWNSLRVVRILFFVSVLTGDITPVLAVSYEWKDNLTLVMETRKGKVVGWNSIYSTRCGVYVQLHETAPSPRYGGSGQTAWHRSLPWITTRWVSLPRPILLSSVYAHTLIVPKHVWEGIRSDGLYQSSACGSIPSWRFTPQAVTMCGTTTTGFGPAYVDQVVYRATL